MSHALHSLAGKKGLVVGIANDKSIAYGCAKAFAAAGAELAVTYLNEKAEKYVRPLAEEVGAKMILPLDVTVPGELETVFAEITEKWGKLDFVLHAIAFAPKEDLHGRIVDSSAEGFARAMDVSCHSFIRMAGLAEPLMKDGGTLLTLSYYGAQKFIQNYGIMGPVKAALESTVQYLAAEMGPRNISVNAISPGPIFTRAASGIANFDSLALDAAKRSPGGRLATIEEVGATAAFVVSPLARAISGMTIQVDAGFHVVGSAVETTQSSSLHVMTNAATRAGAHLTA
jgi:enoyl-[acyl-carrier protein] reductase I